MRLDLTRIRTAREHFDKVYDPGSFARAGGAGSPEGREAEGKEEGEPFRVVAPVSLSFDILKDKQQFHLIGTVGTTLELACGRCLEPFTQPVAAEFDLRYQPHSQNTAAGSPGKDVEREIEEDDLSTAFYENDEIDLGQLMREQFYLSLPMKPLCREECLGLCSVCGTNLNRSSCACRQSWVDPRLAALEAFKKES